MSEHQGEERQKSFWLSVREEITKNWVIAILTYLATALLLGFWANLSPFVPLDLKQRDVLFVIFALFLFFCIGLYLLVIKRGWVKKIAAVVLLILSCLAALLYTQRIILHNIDIPDGQAVIVFYPDSFTDKKLQLEMENALVELPKTLSTDYFSAKLISRSSRLSGNIDSTIAGKYIKNHINVIGVIDISEVENAILVELYAPALNVYRDLGFSWVTTDFVESSREKKVTLTAGFQNVLYQLGIDLTVDGPHYGSYEGSFSVAGGIKTKVIGLEEISEYQNLPIPEILEFPAGNISRGIYFSSLMLLTGYSKLSGYGDSFCQSIESFADFDLQTSSHNIFAQLNPLFISSCLITKPRYIEKIYQQADPDQRENIVQLIYELLFSSEEYDSAFSDSAIISAEKIAEVKLMRKNCHLLDKRKTIFEKSSHVVDYLSRRPAFKNSHPLMWRYTVSFIEEELNNVINENFMSFSRKNFKRAMVYYNDTLRKLGAGERSCELPWYTYLLNFGVTLQMDNPSQTIEEFILSEFDQLFKEMEDIAAYNGCNAITLGPETQYDFFLEEEYQQDYKQNISQLISGISNDQPIGTIIGPLINAVCPVLSGEPCSIHQPALLQQDNLQRATEFIQELLTPLLAAFTSEEFSNNIEDYLLHTFSEKTMKTAFELKPSEISELVNANMESDSFADLFISKYFTNLKKIFRDPINQEIFRLIELRIDNTEQFLESSLEPVLQKNPVHTLLLFDLLTMDSLTQQQVDSILGAIEVLYPEQRNSNMYRHFKMIQKHRTGDEQGALDLASLIVSTTDSVIRGAGKLPEQAFYQYYIDSSQKSFSAPDACNAEGDLPGWTNYLAVHHKEAVIDHLFSKTFDEELWQSAVSEQGNTYAANGGYANAEVFSQAVRAYLLNYTSAYPATPASSPKTSDNDGDEALPADPELLNVIDLSLNACAN